MDKKSESAVRHPARTQSQDRTAAVDVAVAAVALFIVYVFLCSSPPPKGGEASHNNKSNAAKLSEK